MRRIDWRRVAEPQEDGYDVQITWEYLARSRYAQRATRPLPQPASLVWQLTSKTGNIPRFVSMADHTSPSSTLFDLPTDSPQVLAGFEQLAKWPAGASMAADLLVALAPLTMNNGQAGHGCTCGNFGDDWGWIYVTADDPWGLAEGIVHEVAHWKLRAFDVQFEEWSDLLLLNKPTDLYTSPVRKDMPRPMGAVLHAQYSYVHVAAQCVAMLKATEKPTQGDIDWTALQLFRITEGQNTLREHARGTPQVGDLFLAGLDDWTTRVLLEGNEVVCR